MFRIPLSALVAVTLSMATAGHAEQFAIRDGQVGCNTGSQAQDSDRSIEFYGEQAFDDYRGDSTNVGFKYTIELGGQKAVGIDPQHCAIIARQAAERQRIALQRDQIELALMQIRLEQAQKAAANADMSSDGW